MIWHENHGIGIHECGFYTIRRCTYDYEVWYKNGKEFCLVGRATHLKEAKIDAEQHHKGRHETHR